jgi:hypothetical protein
LIDEYEEKKIQHERVRREEIKRMQEDTQREKQRIRDDAKKEIENTKRAL